jgi:hypothetical protein
MTVNLPHTYTDIDGATLHVEKGKVTANRRVESLVYLSAQDPEKVVALVRAILAASGNTGYTVVCEADMVAQENAAAHSAAWSMRERAMRAASDAPGTPAEAIRALPLTGNADPGDEAPASGAVRDLSAIREAEIRAVRDAAYDEGHADGLRMGTARADDKRLSDLEEQYADLADLAEKLRADLGQAYAAVTGVGKLLRDHISSHQAHAAEVERRLTALDGESP